MAGWAVALMRSRGSVSGTYTDGDYAATATAEGVVVTYLGVPVSSKGPA